jgi:hypothetical protein
VTINADTPVFPNNIIALMKTRGEMMEPGIACFRRPLRSSDPETAIGFYAATWEPDERSLEIGHAAPQEPTLQKYLVAAQAFVKDGDEERGLARHSVLSKMIRTMLYRDEPLRVGLSMLSVSMNGSVESARRWGIRSQRYLSNELDGSFLYLSTLEFWLETETV